MSDFDDRFDDYHGGFDDDVSFSSVDSEDDFDPDNLSDLDLSDRQHGESDPEEENFDNSPGFSQTLRSLVDLSAFKVARSFHYNYISSNFQLPDVLLKRILRYQFPVDTRELLEESIWYGIRSTFTDKNIHIVEQIGSVLHGHVKFRSLFGGSTEDLISCTADRGAISASFCSICNKKIDFCEHVKGLLKLYLSKSFDELKICLPISPRIDVLSKTQLKSVINNLINKANGIPGLLTAVNDSIEEVDESREFEADFTTEDNPYSQPPW